jgi:peptidoglycan-associated lipoprotein
MHMTSRSIKEPFAMTAKRATTRIAALSLLLASVGLAGCAHKPKELPPQPISASTSTQSGQQFSSQSQQPSGPIPGSEADFMASVISDTVHFAFNMYGIDGESEGILRSQAQWLARYPAKSVTIEGHCDERGTRDYNLALGERRANAAKNYLVALGIDAGRINTISYGKERPIALGSDEAAWAKNRRAVTITVN